MDASTGDQQSPQVEGLLGWLAAAWETLPAQVGMTVGPSHVVVYQNAASRALFGSARLGMPLGEALSVAADVSSAERDVAFATGQPVVGPRRVVGIRDLVGQDVHMQYVIAPFGPSGEPPVGLVISAVDRSGEVRAELASNRAAMLSTVTERITAAVDALDALRALVDVLVPELADVAAIYVLPDLRDVDDLRSRRTGAPDAISIAPSLAGLGPPPVSDQGRADPSPWDAVFASGQPVIIPFEDIDPALAVPDEASRAWLQAAGTRNLAAVPVAVAGRIVGALLLVAAGDRQPFSELILPFLSDIVARAGVAVAQIRHLRRQVEVSHRLQQVLLPAAPPRVAGLRMAARYVTGSADVEVGGDWWDVAQLDGAQLSIGVGDVAGRGIDAAVVMGQVRLAMRTASLAGLAPHQVLDLLDRQVAELVARGREHGVDGPQFATALYGVLDLSTGDMELANAGHLPLLVSHPDGTVEVHRSAPAAPLGIEAGPYSSTTIHIPAGATLLMYTDGLVENHHRDLDAGLNLLANQLASRRADDVKTWLDGILGGMGVLGPDAPGAVDDVAAVLVHREPSVDHDLDVGDTSRQPRP
jgi:Stage II sporulation protein E (SpoIIE)/GAF domain